VNTTVSTNVTAGLGGFLAFFLLAIALWLLMRNMNARLRRMSFREEAEAQAAQHGPTGGTSTRLTGGTEEDEDAGSVTGRDDDAARGTGRDQEPGAPGGPGVA